MSRFRVAITDHVFPSLDMEFEKLNEIGAEVFLCKDTQPQGLVSELKDVDAILNCYVQLNKTVIDSLAKCKIIARYGIGVNNVDVKAASDNNIIVTNVPDYCISEVSDHALGLIIALARKIIQVNQNAKSGFWSFESSRPIFRLAGKTLGLVGFGNIARSLAKKANAIDLKVIFFDPYFKGGLEGHPGLDKCATLDELLAQSDFVSVHTPLTEETSGMIGLAQMKIMKPNACLVNTSRGGIINEGDLLVALRDSVIAGAALDVLANENQVESSPLINLENIILTPHCGFYSEESTEELRVKALNEVISVLTGGKPRYQVNRA